MLTLNRHYVQLNWQRLAKRDFATRYEGPGERPEPLVRRRIDAAFLRPAQQMPDQVFKPLIKELRLTHLANLLVRRRRWEWRKSAAKRSTSGGSSFPAPRLFQVASLPFARPPLGCGDHHVDVMAAAAGAYEPLFPIRHGCRGAISLGVPSRIRFDLVTARPCTKR